MLVWKFGGCCWRLRFGPVTVAVLCAPGSLLAIVWDVVAS